MKRGGVKSIDFMLLDGIMKYRDEANLACGAQIIFSKSSSACSLHYQTKEASANRATYGRSAWSYWLMLMWLQQGVLPGTCHSPKAGLMHVIDACVSTPGDHIVSYHECASGTALLTPIWRQYSAVLVHLTTKIHHQHSPTSFPSLLYL